MKNKPFFSQKRHIVGIVSIVLLIIFLVGRSNLLFSSNSEQNNKDQTSKSSPPTGTAINCLKSAIDTIEQLPSFSTEIQLELHLFNEIYKGTGKYQELSHRTTQKSALTPPSKENNVYDLKSPLKWNSFRLHVKMLPQNAKVNQSNDVNENRLDVVCDQNGVWNYTVIEGQTQLSYLNIEEMANNLFKLNTGETEKLQESGIDKPCVISGFPALGGLSGTLKNLLANYDFEPEITRIPFDGKDYPAWKLVGTLKKNKMDAIKKRYEATIATETEYFYEFLPVRVEVYIGCNTNFPCQIKYFGLQNQTKELISLLLEINFVLITLNDNSLRPEIFNYQTPQKTYKRKNKDYMHYLIPGIEL